MIRKSLSIVLLIGLFFGVASFVYAQGDEIEPEGGLEEVQMEEPAPVEVETSFEKARVISIEEKSETITTEEGEIIESYREIGVEMLSGAHKGEQAFFKDSPQTNPFGMEFDIGQKLLMHVEDYGDSWQVAVDSHYRAGIMIWLVVLFFIFLLILAGWRRGLKTILSLVVSIILIFMVLVPSVLAGYSALLVTFVIVAVVATVTLFLVGGRNKKTLAAILGTISGVLVAFLVAYVFSNLANLIGLSTEEERLLASTVASINPKNLCLAGIIIGALGAAMDVGISVASSIKEVKEANNSSGFKQLFSSGMNVGRDIIGTMSNTLIFAYVGAALPTILLFQNLGESWFKFINFNFIADEIVRSVGGSIGLVAVIPLTALFASYFYQSGQAKSPKSRVVRRTIDKK
jgi:uncharacterized membrane protein